VSLINGNGNGKSKPIIPWGFVVTIESTERIDPNDLLFILDKFGEERTEVVGIQVEALGSIKIQGN